MGFRGLPRDDEYPSLYRPWDIIHLAKNMITSVGGDRPHGTRLLLQRRGVCQHTRVKRARKTTCVVDPHRNSFASRILSLWGHINECAPDRCTGAQASLGPSPRPRESERRAIRNRSFPQLRWTLGAASARLRKDSPHQVIVSGPRRTL